MFLDVGAPRACATPRYWTFTAHAAAFVRRARRPGRSKAPAATCLPPRLVERLVERALEPSGLDQPLPGAHLH